MEDEMLRTRIFTAGAVMAVILAVSGGATAQNNEQPGKPLALLAGLTPPHEKKTVAHAKPVHRTAAKTAAKTTARSVRTHTIHHANAVAAKASSDLPAAPAPSALPENVWPAPADAASADVAAEPPATAAANDDPALGAMVVNGQTVKIKPADEINEIDLAADGRNAAANTATPTDRAEFESAPAPVVAVAAREAASPVGSASWIAQVMAALGGAIAAGSVAWFLIGSGPQRTYG
jgi:hypothetical protein